ncbi:hypothetical protein B6U67_05970 [Methanosarcinales archaeon ex4484_138]|nr:MAG: hypothetical protein B6U67_05970 [Methanosarcinales archaeon ex4484_138]
MNYKKEAIGVVLVLLSLGFLIVPVAAAQAKCHRARGNSIVWNDPAIVEWRCGINERYIESSGFCMADKCIEYNNRDSV